MDLVWPRRAWRLHIQGSQPTIDPPSSPTNWNHEQQSFAWFNRRRSSCCRQMDSYRKAFSCRHWSGLPRPMYDSWGDSCPGSLASGHHLGFSSPGNLASGRGSMWLEAGLKSQASREQMMPTTYGTTFFALHRDLGFMMVLEASGTVPDIKEPGTWSRSWIQFLYWEKDKRTPSPNWCSPQMFLSRGPSKRQLSGVQSFNRCNQPIYKPKPIKQVTSNNKKWLGLNFPTQWYTIHNHIHISICAELFCIYSLITISFVKNFALYCKFVLRIMC